ncbi:MAG: DUF1326 domain-containing protein [Vicinamibacterales bacterium]|jgi:hypothetical protein|nr:hypothetical protein [Acidobacteriota bacterium]MDP6371149.1 DUF1326 domain-containing protein [Vicinamibacterales bacterium]MDP6607960.1 DUF1326 domain-containing protein [Vicinamibacterales bacterium]HAK56937.1 hypothetical protein [Acidobacteriota bacterium]|tara:strand:+ start:13725 stop:14339 length:615 start_codon:yes stop_codon:yes gene_type:complete
MTETPWRAKGLLFENCSCQLICPAHVSFKQYCQNDRCRGHWSMHITEGRYGEVSLDGLNIVVAFDSPVQMYSGNWTQVFYVDERADAAQRQALETIFRGQAGGPWQTLAGFVSKQLDTRYVPMTFEDAGRLKRLTIPEVFDTTIQAIRGSDNTSEAVLSNLHNVIHGPVHVLARGTTDHTDGPLDIHNEKTHGLYSDFSWDNAA